MKCNVGQYDKSKSKMTKADKKELQKLVMEYVRQKNPLAYETMKAIPNTPYGK